MFMHNMASQNIISLSINCEFVVLYKNNLNGFDDDDDDDDE